MNNMKIKVNTESESRKVQELFFELGYKWFSGGNQVQHLKHSCSSSSSFGYLVAWSSGCFTDVIQCGCGNEDAKEITLPELRDLVVLKRNDVGDASHINCNGQYMYEASSGDWYLYHNNAWKSDGVDIDDMPKPIEKKEMKEYLRKNSNDTYSYIGTVRPEHVSDFMIEIPKGCNIITCENRKGNLVYFHWKSLDSDEFFLKDEKIWSNNFDETLSDFIEKNEGEVKIIWSRYTHPEELPFIDDECYTNKSDGGFRLPISEPCDISKWVEIRGDSLNDQYAEIEKVRQSAWQKQEGGSHYKNLKIQPMQYALENKLDYAQANVVKYVTRHKEKNGKEDLLKAIHNIELMIEFYYGDEK